MTKILIGAAAAAMMAVSTTAFAGDQPSAQMCKAWFAEVDRNGDGSLGYSENADRYFQMISRSSSDNGQTDSHIMGRSFFLAECQVGSFGMMKG